MRLNIGQCNGDYTLTLLAATLVNFMKTKQLAKTGSLKQNTGERACEDSRLEHRLEPFFHASHAKPRTRRELVGQGFKRGLTTFMAPSLLGALGGRHAVAQAAECGLGNAQATLPVIMFDLNGGGALCGSNICVGRGGDNTESTHFSESAWVKFGHPSHTRYNSHGDNVDRSLGLAFPATSSLLAGIKNCASMATTAKTNGMVFGCESDNDININHLNPCYALSRAGLGGAILPLIGSSGGAFGGRSIGPYFDPSQSPALVSNAAQARSLVDIKKISEVMAGNAANTEKALKLIESLSTKRIEKLNTNALAKALFACTYTNASDIALADGGADKIDPTLDALLDTAFKGRQKLKGSFHERTAAAAKLVLNGFVGAATIELEGFDYHNSTRTAGEEKDMQAGQCIGAVLEYANLLNQPVMIYVFTDGGIQGSPTTDETGLFVWGTDDSTTAGTFMLHFDPAGRVPFVNHQVGDFDYTGSSVANPITTRDQRALCDAIAANYLALSGRLGEFSKRFNATSLDTNNMQAFVGVEV